MDFTLTEDQQAFRDTARQFATGRMLPEAARWDAEKIFPEEVLRAAAALGFGGIYVRDDVGGGGLSRLDAALIMEELAAACPSGGLHLDPQHGRLDDRRLRRRRAAPPLPAQALLNGAFRQLLPDRARRRLGCRGLSTRAEPAGDHYVVNGTKAFISGGGRSDIYVVMLRTEAGGISTLVVENGTPGMSFGKQEQKLGWNSQPTAAVIFENCKVPVANRLARRPLQDRHGGARRRAHQYRRLFIGRRARLPRTASRYVVERKQFGKPIADFQATQFKLADMATELDAARLLIWRAASLLDAKSPEATQAAAMGKRFATDVGFKVVNDALQLHGGYGYLKDFPIERYCATCACTRSSKAPTRSCDHFA